MSSTPDPRWQLDPNYRVEPFSEQSSLGESDIIELWTKEGGLPPSEAQRRLSEVLLVAGDRDGRLAGVATAYLAHSDQLRAELWYFRTMVASAHRNSNIAVTVALRGREYLDERYATGADGRGIGIIFEVENEGLRRAFPQAHWMPTDFLFIGESARGAHVRVHYFPGAPAPEPE